MATAISTLSLSDLKETFGLVRDRDDSFFQNWLLKMDELSAFERQMLERLRRNYANIIETNPLEEVVKLVVVAPLLDLSGFYQPPFSIRAEASVVLEAADQGTTFTGRIDVLVVKSRFWVLVIESKQAQFDVIAGIPQALSYLLSQPDSTAAREYQFAMVTNGREVVFLRRTAAAPIYSQSNVYQVLDREGDLVEILQGLKWIGQYAAS